MDSLDLLRDLCERFGVPEPFGAKLRPLVDRALKSPPQARKRILDMVERSFAQESIRLEERTVEAARVNQLTKEDRAALKTVADILHTWAPPGWLGEGLA